MGESDVQVLYTVSESVRGNLDDAERRHVHGCNCGIRPDGDSGQRPRAQHTGSARMNNAIAAELVQRGFGEGGP